MFRPLHETDPWDSVRRRRLFVRRRSERAFNMTSGNSQADRRLEFALALKAEGDYLAAASALEQVLELAPDWAAAHFTLGEVREAACQRDAAIAAYAACLVRDPDDVMGAGVRLALMGATPMPAALPEAYVQTLFDQYAPAFERSLLGNLSYRAPRQLREAVESLISAEAKWARVLDIGCGTGLAGEVFRGRAAWLEGVDLSAGMVAVAGRKKLYDQLETAEAVGFLGDLADASYDFAVAADVVIYMGDLAPLFTGVARILKPGALFALTTQRGEGEGYLLGGEHRFSHSVPYLRRIAAGAGLEVALLRDAVCRTEKGQDVPSLVCVLRKPVPAMEVLPGSLPPGRRSGSREPGSMPV